MARIDGRYSVLPAVARRQPLTKTQGMRTVQDEDEDFLVVCGGWGGGGGIKLCQFYL